MGEPIPGNSGISITEHIGGRGRTKGTETSKYLQEKKARAIPKVAASEMGTAQTACMSSLQALYMRGCGSLLEGVAAPSASHKFNG